MNDETRLEAWTWAGATGVLTTLKEARAAAIARATAHTQARAKLLSGGR